MVLITGGNGLMGSRLARALSAVGHRVRVLGLPQPASDAALQSAGIDVQYGDVTHPADLAAAMRGVHTVFHLAAVLASPEDPARFHRVNTEGTRLTLAAAHIVSVTHFIFISSISVTYPEHNAYSASKAAAETLVRDSALPWTIVRPCLVLDGRGGGEEYRAFAAAVLRWPVLPLPRRGGARKRPVHVEDLCRALIRIPDEARCRGKTYALGGSEVVTLAAMAAAVLRNRGRVKAVLPVPEKLLRASAWAAEMLSRLRGRRLSWASRQSLHGLLYDAAPDIQAARDDLGFVPRGFTEIVQMEKTARDAETAPVEAAA